MKTLPSGLQAHLDGGATTLAWCWRLIRRDATAFGFTDHDRGYQYACDARLGDTRCGIDLGDPAHSAPGIVTAVEAPWLLGASGLGAFADGWCDGGLLSWTSGANAGREMEVKRFTQEGGAARIELWRSMAGGIALGDGFTITAGCDKTFATCRAKFANGTNFRGFPSIPGNRYVF